MKFKIATILTLIGCVYVIILNGFYEAGIFPIQDEAIRIGFHSGPSGTSISSFSPVATWLNLPYYILFQFVGVLFFGELTRPINKGVRNIFLSLWSLYVIAVLIDFFFSLYICTHFQGDELFLPEEYWRREGMNEYPVIAFFVQNNFSIVQTIATLQTISIFALVPALILLFKREKAIGIAGFALVGTYLCMISPLPGMHWLYNFGWLVFLIVSFIRYPKLTAKNDLP